MYLRGFLQQNFLFFGELFPKARLLWYRDSSSVDSQYLSPTRRFSSRTAPFSLRAGPKRKTSCLTAVNLFKNRTVPEYIKSATVAYRSLTPNCDAKFLDDPLLIRVSPCIFGAVALVAVKTPEDLQSSKPMSAKMINVICRNGKDGRNALASNRRLNFSCRPSRKRYTRSYYSAHN